MFDMGELQEYLYSRNETNKFTRTKYVSSHIINYQLVSIASANNIWVAYKTTKQTTSCRPVPLNVIWTALITLAGSTDTMWQLTAFLVLL